MRTPVRRDASLGEAARLRPNCFLLGDCDGLAIVEFPDNAAAAATSMRASA